MGHTAFALGEAELPAYYRREAARLRCEVDQAETIEIRIALPEAVEQADKLAASFGG